VAEARRLKPTIPLVGENGLPCATRLDLERILVGENRRHVVNDDATQSVTWMLQAPGWRWRFEQPAASGCSTPSTGSHGGRCRPHSTDPATLLRFLHVLADLGLLSEGERTVRRHTGRRGPAGTTRAGPEWR
jgi:hypothetical protein